MVENINEIKELLVGGFAQIEERFEQIDARFEQVDARFVEIDKRFTAVDKRFDEADDLSIRRLRSLEHKLTSRMDFSFGMLRDDIAGVRDFLDNKILQTNKRIGELREPMMSLSGAYADAMVEIDNCKVENILLGERIDRLEAQAN